MRVGAGEHMAEMEPGRGGAEMDVDERRVGVERLDLLTRLERRRRVRDDEPGAA